MWQLILGETSVSQRDKREKSAHLLAQLIFAPSDNHLSQLFEI